MKIFNQFIKLDQVGCAKVSTKLWLKVLISLLALTALVIFISLGAAYTHPSAQWHMINVNSARLQGDANLLSIGNVIILIDAGYEGEAQKHLVPYLRKLGVNRIDHFFISHPHRDHYEGLKSVLEAGIEVKKLYYRLPPADVRDCCYDKGHFHWYLKMAIDHGVELITPSKGFILSLPYGSSIEILHAQEGNLPGKPVDVNDLSLIMQWRIYDYSVLFTGDLNKTVGDYLAGDRRFRSTFLKMPHHGGRGIAPNSFFDTVDPEYVLVPGPKWVWCGERGDQARQWTISKKLPTWVNGINGTVRVDFNPFTITIKPEITSGECKAQAFGTVTVSRPITPISIFSMLLN